MTNKINDFLHANLTKVCRPAQYLGNEFNVVHKDWNKSKIKVCLVFPDTYGIGMSNLAVQILYAAINHHSDHLLERAFIPEDDMRMLMKEQDIPLFSWESRRPLQDFDVIAFTISTELSYTNVLYCLELSGIPLLRSQAEEGPLVLAGGGGVVNPLPMSDFLDGIFIGDGEQSFVRVLDRLWPEKQAKNGLAGMRSALTEFSFLYVAGWSDLMHPVQQYTLKNWDNEELLEKPLVPHVQVVHNRLSVDLMKGCPRSCRFCQASFINKPWRTKPYKLVESQARKWIRETGLEEFSLASLSSSDYPRIVELMKSLEQVCVDRKVRLSLPSLRMDSFTRDISWGMNKIRHSGVTLAPEAGSQFLRDVIQKRLSEKEIIEAVQQAAQWTVKKIKLYFMIGLPREENGDIEALVDLVFNLKRAMAPRRNKLVVNISNFVPKPFTPFQWAKQDSLEDTARKLGFLKTSLRDRQIELRWTDPEVSWVEGLLSRGDSSCGALILKAYQSGAVFDAWYDQFNVNYWTAAAEAVPDVSKAIQGLHPDKPVPWTMIKMNHSGKLLRSEWDKAHQVSRETP